MLSIITKYLVQYKSVCIPGIGTFELLQQSPQLDVADKQFLPPFFITRFNHKEEITSHQFHFFAAVNEVDEEMSKKELLLFGEKLRTFIQQKPFAWNGFGTLHYSGSGISFDAQQINLSSLQKIPAEKVLRENVHHHVLVGDQQMTRQIESLPSEEPRPKKPVAIVIGWVILGLTIAAIGVLLYLGKFDPASSGLKMGL